MFAKTPAPVRRTVVETVAEQLVGLPYGTPAPAAAAATDCGSTEVDGTPTRRASQDLRVHVHVTAAVTVPGTVVTVIVHAHDVIVLYHTHCNHG